jgi:N-acetyl-anhydromuramyl-L-alanine amidase AmpD
MLEWLQAEIDSSEKIYLLHGRREPQKDKPPAQITSCMRHYLTMVKTQKHREALTSVLLSTHLLAVEVLRYVDINQCPDRIGYVGYVKQKLRRLNTR